MRSNLSFVFWRLLYSCLHLNLEHLFVLVLVSVVWIHVPFKLAHVLHSDLAPHLLTVLHSVIEPVQQWYFQLVACWPFCLKKLSDQAVSTQRCLLTRQMSVLFCSIVLLSGLFHLMGSQLMTWERHEQLRLRPFWNYFCISCRVHAPHACPRYV